MNSNSSPLVPDRVSLAKKKQLAEKLQTLIDSGSRRDAARFTWSHPKFQGQDVQSVLESTIQLADAQQVIAHESGFVDWQTMEQYLQTIQAAPNGSDAIFESAVETVITGQAGRLKEYLQKHPSLATSHSRRDHQANLLHYVAANGVENDSQIVPDNALEIASILINAGCPIDATCQMYGGGSGTTPLAALVTSTHPYQAGLQPQLTQLFCQAGARPNGLDDDGLPISLALGFRYPETAQVLAKCGARIDNLPTAAAVGTVEDVNAFLDPNLGKTSASCHFPNPNHPPFPASNPPHPDATLSQSLIFAAMNQRSEIVEALLQLPIDINAGPRSGITALHEACYQGHQSIAKRLVEHGADPRQTDQHWNSDAVQWAKAGGHESLAQWLVDQDQTKE